MDRTQIYTPTRNTDLNTIMFSVEPSDFFVSIPKMQSSLGDLASETVSYQKVPHYRALVNTKTGRILSVVSHSYRVVKNEEALELGKGAFRQLFGTIDTKEMDVWNIISPESGSFCHIDLVHQHHILDVMNNEVWLPYIRVTNSYNRQFALQFNLGFVRHRCNNGMIFAQKTIVMKFLHTKREIKPEGEFSVDFKELKQLEVKFVEYTNNLKRYYVPEKFMLPIVYKAFNIPPRPEANDAASQVKWGKRFDTIHDAVAPLTAKYFNELGPNGYATLNVLTDAASRPFGYPAQSVMIDPLQRRATDWMVEFVEQIGSKSFNFDVYLKDYLHLAA